MMCLCGILGIPLTLLSILKLEFIAWSRRIPVDIWERKLEYFTSSWLFFYFIIILFLIYSLFSYIILLQLLSLERACMNWTLCIITLFEENEYYFFRLLNFEYIIVRLWSWSIFTMMVQLVVSMNFTSTFFWRKERKLHLILLWDLFFNRGWINCTDYW